MVMAQVSPNIAISATDINLILHSYLLDAGLTQTALSLFNEAGLKDASNVSAKMPKLHLLSMLTRALAYTEIETHVQKEVDGQACIAPFELILPHVCAHVPILERVPQTASVSEETDVLPRLPSLPPAEDAPQEAPSAKRKERSETPVPMSDKRSRIKEPSPIGPVEMQLDSPVIPAPNPTSEQPPRLVQDPAGGMLAEQRRVGEKSKRSASAEDFGLRDVPVVNPVEMSSIPAEDVLFLEGHSSDVYSVAWNPTCADLLATTSKDSTARIWSLPPSHTPGRRPHLLKHEPTSSKTEITDLAWNPDGMLVATAATDGLCRLFTSSGEFYKIWNHGNNIICLQWSPSGQTLLTGSLDGTVGCWTPAKTDPMCTFRPHSGSGSVLDLKFTGEDTFASSSTDKSVVETRISTGAPRRFRGHNDDVNKIVTSPCHQLLASCSDDHTARVWDLTTPWEDFTGEHDMFGAAVGCKFVLRGHSAEVVALSWRTQEFIVTGSNDSSARLWEAASGTCVRIFEGASDPLHCIEFSPDGEAVATGSREGRFRVFNVRNGQVMKEWVNDTVKSNKGTIFDLQWDKDGTRVALALENKKAVLLRVGGQ